MNEKEVLKRGYAKTPEEWWFLVDHYWDDLYSIIARFNPRSLSGATKAKTERSRLPLYRFLYTAWDNAPDSPSIHSTPGWGVLCAICSDFPVEDGEEKE